MTEDEFWNIIERGRGSSQESTLQGIKDLLGALRPQEVLEFEAVRFRVVDHAHTVTLWGAAYLICGGCSDDGFDYFKEWLVLQGKKMFYESCRNPDSLAESMRGDYPSCEEFWYLASTVYEELVGSPPNSPPSPLPNPGEFWDFDSEAEQQQRYPKLWKRFSDDPL